MTSRRQLAATLAVLCGCAPAIAQQADPRPATLPTVVVSGAPPSERLSLDEPSQTGSRLALTPRQTPASVSIVDRDQIEQRGAMSTQDILTAVPGMTASSPPGSAGSVFYRGFGASQLSQMFNGISVQYDAIAARPIDSWIYERVEVIGGPSSFLFGAGAVGGSINYLTKMPVRGVDFNQARLSYGSFGTSNLSFGVNRSFGQPGGVRNTVRLDANQMNSSGWVEGEQRRALTAAGSLLTDINGRLSHTLAFEYQHEHVDRPYWGTPLLNPTIGQGRIDPGTRFKNYNSIDGLYEQKVAWGRSIIDYRLGEATTLRNTLYVYDALRDYRNVEAYRFNTGNNAVVRSSPLLQRHDQEVVGNRVEVTHRSRIAGLSSDWAGGLDYSVNHQTRYPRSLTLNVSTVNPYDFATERFFDVPGMAQGFVPDRHNQVNTMALFVENRTRVTDRLALVSGLRHDRINLEVSNLRTASATDPAYFSNRYHPTTGRVGLVYDLTPNASLYAQYSTSADPPAGILTTASFSQVRDFDLSTGRQFEVGSKFDYWQGKGSATVALYTITRKNLATPDPANPGTTLPVGQRSARGIELSTGVRLAPTWLLQGQLAWTDAQYDDFSENVSGVAISRVGNQPANLPTWVSGARLGWDFAAGWQAAADLRYVSRRYGNAANTVWDGGYTLLGASVSHKVSKNVQVSLRGRNLTDKVYAANVTGTPMFYLGAPRSLELMLQATF